MGKSRATERVDAGFKRLVHVEDAVRNKLRGVGQKKLATTKKSQLAEPGLAFMQLPGRQNPTAVPVYTAPKTQEFRATLELVKEQQPKGTTYLLGTEANQAFPGFNVGYLPSAGVIRLVPKSDRELVKSLPDLAEKANTLSNSAALTVAFELGGGRRLDFQGTRTRLQGGELPIATFSDSNNAVAVQTPRKYVNNMRQAAHQFGAFVMAKAELGEARTLLASVEPNGFTRVYPKGTAQDATAQMKLVSKLVDGPLQTVHDVLKGRFQNGQPLP